MSKIFVGNFSFSVDSDKLKEFFSPVGTVVSAKVMTEGEGGRSRGFGFVEMSSAEEAQKAISELNGVAWEGRQIKVSEDRGPRRQQQGGRPPHSSGGRDSGSRFQGSSGGGSRDRGGNNKGGGYQDRSSYAPVGYFRAQPLDMGVRRRRKIDPFLEDPKLVVDYKDPRLLTRFLSERGKILPRRMTGLTAANQRQVTRAIKRAQHLALLSFTEA